MKAIVYWAARGHRDKTVSAVTRGSSITRQTQQETHKRRQQRHSLSTSCGLFSPTLFATSNGRPPPWCYYRDVALSCMAIMKRPVTVLTR
jgi:hypothetical protein